MHSLWLPGGLAPPCRVISSGRKSLYNRHTASTEAYSVKMAALFSVSLHDGSPFDRRNNEDKLATIQLGPPRPNITIKQVATKKGKSYTRGFSKNWYQRKSWLAGCEVANVVCIPIYHCHFS